MYNLKQPKMENLQEQLQALEAQRQELIERQRQLEVAAQEAEQLREMTAILESSRADVIAQQKQQNAILTQLHALVGDDPDCILKHDDVVVDQHVLSTHYRLKRHEDKLTLSTDTMPWVFISTPYGNISPKDVSRSGKVSSYIFSSRREIKVETAAAQLKIRLQARRDKQTRAASLIDVGNALIEQFTAQFPGAEMERTTKWISERRGGREIPVIKINFPNGSRAVLQYGLDGTWYFVERFDAKMSKLNRKELLEYLAS